MRGRRSILPGILLIVVGVVALGAVGGWWQLDWRTAVALWPALLIVGGLRLLLPAARWADWLVAVVVAVAVTGFLAAPQSWRDSITHRPAGNVSGKVSQGGGQDVQNLDLTLKLAASDARLSALGSASPQLYQADTRGATLVQDYNRSGSSATATLATGSSDVWFMAPGRTFNLELSPKPALHLSLNSGASDAHLDFSGLNLATLDMNGGATTTDIKLGRRAARQQVTFKGGASDITVHVPTGAALKLSRQGGLTDDNFDSLGLTHSGDTFVSAGFDSAPLQITVSFNGGASSIIVERY